MTATPDLAEFARLAGRFPVVPVWRELLADTETPVGLFRRLGTAEGSVLLEHGGFSYLGLDPVTILLVRDGVASWTGGPICPVPAGASLVETLRAVAGSLRAPEPAGLPWSPAGGFCVLGGDAPQPDGAVVFPGAVIVVDHRAQRLRLVANVQVEPGRAAEAQYAEALSRLDDLAARLATTERFAPVPLPAPAPAPPFESEIPDDAYHEMIEAAHRRVVAGELRQVTVSRRFHAPATVDPLTAYRVLRVTNPSPYHYLARLPGVTLVGASPLGLVRVRDRDVTTYVIAGTRPRGEDAEADEKLAAELLADPKEREEHAMLVDLAQADLAAVAVSGTVGVVDHRLVRYSQVMHLSTEVAATLGPDHTALDAVAAVLPSGTVAGMPREAALRVIADLEPRRRGLYGGAVGVLDFAGNLDLCLGIRTLQFGDACEPNQERTHSEAVYCQAGAGVVADSVADREVAESRAKARALFVALATAARLGNI